MRIQSLASYCVRVDAPECCPIRVFYLRHESRTRTRIEQVYQDVQGDNSDTPFISVGLIMFITQECRDFLNQVQYLWIRIIYHSWTVLLFLGIFGSNLSYCLIFRPE